MVSGFTAASLVLWLCTVMGSRCVQQLLEPYPLWFVRSAFKRLRILPRPYRRAAYYHSFFNSLRGGDIDVLTTQGLQAASYTPLAASGKVKTPGLGHIIGRCTGVAWPYSALGIGIGRGALFERDCRFWRPVVYLNLRPHM